MVRTASISSDLVALADILSLSRRQDDGAERFTSAAEAAPSVAAGMGEPLGSHHLLRFSHSVTP